MKTVSLLFSLLIVGAFTADPKADLVSPVPVFTIFNIGMAS